MDERRIPPAGDPIHAAGTRARAVARRTGSTRHCRADRAFIGLLEEDFGIEAHALNAAFMGVPPAPKRQCIELCEWAIRAAPEGDAGEAGDALRAWARKHRVGTYSPRMQDPDPPTFGGRELGACEVAARQEELHHAVLRCLLRLREAADGELRLAGVGAWLEFELEAERWGVPVEISREDLERLVEASTVVLGREKHRLLHASDWQRWGRRGGLATLRRHGTGWYSALALKRWGRITDEDLAAMRFFV